MFLLTTYVRLGRRGAADPNASQPTRSDEGTGPEKGKKSS